MKEIKRTIRPTCTFYCDIDVGPDASLEEQEIRNIYSESIGGKINGKYYSVDLSEFVNADQQTIGEYLLEKYEDFVIALSKEGDL